MFEWLYQPTKKKSVLRLLAEESLESAGWTPDERGHYVATAPEVVITAPKLTPEEVRDRRLARQEPIIETRQTELVMNPMLLPTRGLLFVPKVLQTVSKAKYVAPVINWGKRILTSKPARVVGGVFDTAISPKNWIRYPAQGISWVGRKTGIQGLERIGEIATKSEPYFTSGYWGSEIINDLNNREETPWYQYPIDAILTIGSLRDVRKGLLAGQKFKNMIIPTVVGVSANLNGFGPMHILNAALEDTDEDLIELTDEDWDKILGEDWDNEDWDEVPKYLGGGSMIKPYTNDLLADIYVNNIVWEFENAAKENCENGECYEYTDNKGIKNYGPGISEKKYEEFGLDTGQTYSIDELNEKVHNYALKLLEDIDKYIPGVSPKGKLLLLDIKYNTGKSLRKEFPKLVRLLTTDDYYPYRTKDEGIKQESWTYDSKTRKPLTRRNEGKELLWDLDDLENINFNLKA